MQKEDAHLDHIDVRDLRLLATLLETRSVTRTAERLGLSQPAASRALDRLRRLFGDRLVVRTSKGGALTPRAQALAPHVLQALSAIHDVFAPAQFDPRTSSGIIRIDTTDYGAAVVAAPLSARLTTIAPGLRVHISPFGPDTFDRLADGRADLSLYTDAEVPPDVHVLDLFRETYSCLIRGDHPVLHSHEKDERRLLGELARFPRAVMLYPEGQRVLEDDVLPKLLGGATGHATLMLPYFFSAPAAIAHSDMSLCLPSRVADLVASAHGLYAFRLRTTLSFPYRLLWHERVDRDQQHVWIRSTIARMFTQ